VKKAIFALIGAGALLLAVSQFLPLFHTHVPTMEASVGSGSVGNDHSYGVLPLAALAVLLGLGVYVARSRFALALVGLLGVAALAIALGADLSDARSHGLRLIAGRYETGTNVVGFGLYVEIAGALLLFLAAGFGFLLGEPAPGDAAANRQARPPGRPGQGGQSGPRRRSRSEVIARRETPDA
jgi:hypothetical protein